MATLREQAIAYIKSGDKEQARQILIESLRQDPKDENAWLWMTQVVDTDAERIKCLQYVLKINPDNERAKRGLAQLQGTQALQEPAPASELPLETQGPPASESEIKEPQVRPPGKRRKINPWKVLVGLVVLALICFCVVTLLLLPSLLPVSTGNAVSLATQVLLP